MKNKDINVDLLLKKALNSNVTPDPQLVQKVKYKLIKEENILKKSAIKRSISVAAVAAIAFVLITTSAFAAWYFLSPSEVANKLSSPVLAEAFRGDNALLINETKSQYGYDVSFLGIVSGSGLTELDEAVNTAKTYAVVAIAKKEGSMPEVSSDEFGNVPFFVSPLIKGQTPWLFNIASMNGGYSACVVDGIMYRLIECDSIEMFADRGLSLIVSSTSFYSIEAYTYDEATGMVTPNPSFDGVNLIFDLPLNPANADYEKAQQYLDTLWEEDEPESTRDITTDVPEADETYTLTAETLNDTEAVTRKVMTYEEYKAWVEQELAQIQKLVDSGKYSKSSMELDRNDYESNLNEIKNGAVLTMYSYADGSYRVTITYPNASFTTSTDENGGIIITD